MASAMTRDIGYVLTEEQKTPEYLADYEPDPEKRLYPSVPSLSVAQWQTLCCGQEYRNLTYNQRICKFVRLNYPDIAMVYDSVGWDRDASGNLS